MWRVSTEQPLPGAWGFMQVPTLTLWLSSWETLSPAHPRWSRSQSVICPCLRGGCGGAAQLGGSLPSFLCRHSPSPSSELSDARCFLLLPGCRESRPRGPKFATWLRSSCLTFSSLAFASEDGGNVPRLLGLTQGPMSPWRPQGDTGHAGAALQDPLPLLWPEAVETSAETWEEEHGTRCQAQCRAIAAAAPPAGSLPPREG